MAMCKVSSSVHFVSRSAAGQGKAHWVPDTDMYETENGLVIKVELAGMRSDNLEITVEGNRLRISGNRPDGCRAPKASFLMMEINYGPFESVLELPPGSGYDLGQAKAAYLNGFLRIDVPLAQSKTKSTKVPIAEGN
jgi:HSP20 family protein